MNSDSAGAKTGAKPFAVQPVHPQPLQELIAAWPMLPESIRLQIFGLARGAGVPSPRAGFVREDVSMSSQECAVVDSRRFRVGDAVECEDMIDSPAGTVVAVFEDRQGSESDFVVWQGLDGGYQGVRAVQVKLIKPAAAK